MRRRLCHLPRLPGTHCCKAWCAPGPRPHPPGPPLGHHPLTPLPPQPLRSPGGHHFLPLGPARFSLCRPAASACAFDALLHHSGTAHCYAWGLPCHVVGCCRRVGAERAGPARGRSWSNCRRRPRWCSAHLPPACGRLVHSGQAGAARASATTIVRPQPPRAGPTGAAAGAACRTARHACVLSAFPPCLHACCLPTMPACRREPGPAGEAGPHVHAALLPTQHPPLPHIRAVSAGVCVSVGWGVGGAG